MIPGFNHTVMHHGTAYHVQTEDSGLHNPVISTHLFLGGNVLASRRSSYAELVGAGDLETRVRKLMQDQHKEMLRQLIRGAFDREGSAAVASAYQPGELAPPRPASPPRSPPPSAAKPSQAAEPRPTAPRAVPPVPPPLPMAGRRAPAVQPAAARPAAAAAVPRAAAPAPFAPVPAARPPAATVEDPPTLARGARQQQPPPVLIPEIEDEDLLSDRRLDEVILAYLAEAPGPKRG